ncbi:hypothetical protein M434DRAFT_17537 [Hypoxylon sp. CO27-5]|nr:hypothetical protein M434DRAFT_17537 [Hypoxylon sp. CO27-5]
MAFKRKDDNAHSARQEKAPRIAEMEELRRKLILTEELLVDSTQRVQRLEADNTRLKSQMENFQSQAQALQKQNRLLESQLDKVVTGAPSQTMQPIPKQPEKQSDDKELLALNRDQAAYIRRVAPFQNSITSKEVADEYKELLLGVQELAGTWMEPFENDPARAKEIVANAKRNGSAAGVIGWMARVPEITRLTRYGPGDDVVSAILMRWLHEEIFSTRYCRIDPTVERVLRKLERSIRRNMEPERDIFEIRRWRQVTYSGLIAHPNHKSQRAAREKLMVRELEKLFGFLHPRPGYDMAGLLLRDAIRPAMNLHERIQNSLNEVTFEFPSTYTEGRSPDNSKVVSSLLSQADRINCEDVLKSYRDFDLDTRMDQDPVRMLDPICAIAPSAVHHITSGLGKEYTYIDCRAKIIVAWGDRMEREEKLNAMEPNPFYELLK